MLGRRLALGGTVIHGDRRGSQLGFPTANLRLHHRIHPPTGVYGVETEVDGAVYAGAANLGSRPTFHEGEEKPILEVHLIDFPGGDLYGRDVEVRFLFRVRDEKKFSGAEELKKQIQDDIAFVRRRAGR
ncbi:MAG: riboflavin kinase [Planctomycetota bacterium]